MTDGMHRDLAARIDAVDALLGERLNVSGPLAAKLRGARGRLPRGVRRRGRELAETRTMLGNPATARHVDAARAAEACALLERHLKAVQPRKYRKRDRSALLGVIALRVLIVLVLLAIVLRWRGFV